MKAKKEIKTVTDRLLDNGKWLVVVPHTKEEAIKYGKGAQWDTVTEIYKNYFECYNEDGNVYIVIDRLSGHKWQFFFESQSFKDENDENITRTIFFEENDKDGSLFEFFRKERPKDWFYLSYDSVKNFSEGWACARRKGQYSFIDTEGKLIGNGNMWFDYVCGFYKGFSRVQKDGKWSFINKEGELIGNGNAWFDHVGPFDDGLSCVEMDGKWSFINTDGRLIGNGNMWFNSASLFHKGWSCVKKDGKYSVMDTEGKLIGDGNMWFDDIDCQHANLTGVKRDGKWSFINNEGKFIGNGKLWFDNVKDFYNNYIYIK